MGFQTKGTECAKRQTHEKCVWSSHVAECGHTTEEDREGQGARMGQQL